VAEITTGRIRRSTPRAGGLGLQEEFASSKFRHGRLVPAAPELSATPWPRGDLSAASVAQIASLVEVVWPAPPTSNQKRRRSLRLLLDHLSSLPGRTWQQRWEAGVFADGSRRVAELNSGEHTASLGLKIAMSLRVIRPSLQAMRANPLSRYAEMFRQAQADSALDAYFPAVDARPVLRGLRMGAVFDVACALTVYGIRLAELSPEALLHYAWECRRHGLTYQEPRRQGDLRRAAGPAGTA
jgi:hypothetical protein